MVFSSEGMRLSPAQGLSLSSGDRPGHRAAPGTGEELSPRPCPAQLRAGLLRPSGRYVLTPG